MNERRKLLNILRTMWQNPDSVLHRIYASFEELESYTELTVETSEARQQEATHPCPNCGEKQTMTGTPSDVFPYQNCDKCNKTYHINKNLTLRRITDEESERLPAPWVQIIEDIHKKKMAITFKLD